MLRIILLALMFLPSAALSAPGEVAILLEGQLTKGSANEFEELLAASPDAKVLLLDTGGGELADGLQIARMVRERGLDTAVLPEMSCFSACVFIFAAGKNRAALGTFGVHQIYGGDEGTARFQLDFAEVVKVLAESNISSWLIYRMLSTPHRTIYYLSPVEIRDFGLSAGTVSALKAQ